VLQFAPKLSKFMLLHNGLNMMLRLIAVSTINWSNYTPLIHGLDVFWTHQPTILLSAIFSVKDLIPQNYQSTWHTLSNW